MTQEPLVSVCIPVLNGERHLRAALDSALGQSYRPLEVVVVDNASTDSTADILAAYAARCGSRIRCHRNETTIGMVENFNRAVALAQGEYIKVLPHDDVLAPDSIAELMAECRSGDALVVGRREFLFESSSAWQRWFYKNQNRFWRIDRRFGIGRVSPGRYLQIAARNCGHNAIGEPGSALFSAQAFAAVGGFPAGFHQLCDLSLWHALGSEFGLRVVPKVVAYFRVHGHSESSRGEVSSSDARLLEHWRLSTFIVEKLRRYQEPSSYRAARLNLLLDGMRLARYAVAPPTPGDTCPIPLSIRNLARLLTVLPVKRAYQLMALKAGCAILRIVGIQINRPEP